MYNLEGKVQKDIANVEKTFIVPNNCVVVCPWIIRNGFQNISENGYLPANADPYWYGFFQKIFTGNQVITATWEDSTYLTKVENAYKFQYNFQVGKYYQGAVVVGSAEYSTEIEPMTGNEDFLAMKNSSSVVIRFENWVPSEKDMYKLYTIPDLYGGKWYYISNVKALNDLQPQMKNTDDVYFNDTSIPACEVTFTSLVDKLQVSGKAVEQYVQYAGIGEPYIIPLVSEYNSNTGTENQWIEPTKTVSYIPFQPQSANYLQVELQGANAISAVEVEGRVLTYENNHWVSTPWKRLLLEKTYANQVNELNRTSLPSRNFYFFPNETLSFVTSKTFQEDNKTREDALAMNQSAGKISMGSSTQWPNIGNGEYVSNPVPSDGTHWDYNNTNWKPFSYFSTQSEPTLGHDTEGNYYSVDTISYTANDTFVDILNKNSFIYETQPIIPLGFVSSKPYHISSIPIIGKIVSKFWGDITINPNTTQKKPISIGYFMDCDVAGMLANIYSSQPAGTIWSPLGALVGDETKASKYLGTTALNTTLCFSLTDKVSENGTQYDTIYFGQKKKEDGTNVLLSGETYYYGRANQVTKPKNANDIFVIDSITVYALHKGKIKLTAYSDLSNPIWTTTIQSKANWTNSIRDWATTISTGGWGENYCNWEYNDFDWPTRPDKIIGTEVIVNHQQAKSWKHTTFVDDGIPVFEKNKQYKNGFVNHLSYALDEHYALCKNAEAVTEVTVNYTDLGIASVTNRDTFKSYFKQIVIPVTGRIASDKYPVLKTKSDLTYNIDNNNDYIDNFNVGQYGLGKPDIKSLNKNDSPELQNGLWPQGIGFNNQGGVLTTVSLHITLNPTNIYIKITEEDTYICRKHNGDAWEAINNIYQANSWFQFGNANLIETEVNIPKIRLIN